MRYNGNKPILDHKENADLSNNQFSAHKISGMMTWLK